LNDISYSTPVEENVDIYVSIFVLLRFISFMCGTAVVWFGTKSFLRLCHGSRGSVQTQIFLICDIDKDEEGDAMKRNIIWTYSASFLNHITVLW